MSNRIEDWALNAYADGELDATEREKLERQLREDAETRAAMDGIRQQTAALHAAYDAVLDEPIPAHLLAAVKAGRNWHFSQIAAVAASLVMLLAGGFGGWFLAHETRTPKSFDLAQDALVAHEIYTADVKHPVEIAAADKDVLQSWLSKRMGIKVNIPDITANGYQFLGGRLLTAAAAPAGQLMYEAADKGRLTVFFGSNPTGKEEALRVVHKVGLITCYWQERNFSFAVTGDMKLEEMMRLAHDIYDQVEDKA
jgi:anti-sigma factor RsiW